MKTVFVALLQIPYEGEKFIGVYSSRKLAEESVITRWKDLAHEATLLVTEVEINGSVLNSWEVKQPQKEWKEW